MSITTEEELVFTQHLRLAFERDVNPGNTLQGTNNPLIVDLRGQFDLLKAAREVMPALARLAEHKAKVAREKAESERKSHDEAYAAQVRSELAALDAETRPSVT